MVLCLEQFPSGTQERVEQTAVSSQGIPYPSTGSASPLNQNSSGNSGISATQNSESSLSKDNLPASRTPIPGPQEKSADKSNQKRSTLGVLFSMLGSLLLVLGVFFGVIVCLKKILPREKNSLPPELIGCVGQFMLTPKNRLYLVTFGPRLLLLSASPEGLSVLTEVTSPDEVEYFVQCGPKAFTGSSSPLVQEAINRIRKEQREKKEASHEK